MEIEGFTEVILTVLAMVTEPARLAVTLIPVDEIDALAVQRTRLCVAFVDVRLAEETGEASETRALNGLIVDQALATVQAETGIGHCLAQVDLLFATFALVRERTLAFECLIVVDARPLIVARLG